MFYFIFAIHVLLCVALVALVLLQQGKGADAGVAFGGSSNSVFGASGATTMVTKITTGVAIAFMITSILLVRGFVTRSVANVGQPAPISESGLAGSVVESEANTVVPSAESAPEAALPGTPSSTDAEKVTDGIPQPAAPSVAGGEKAQTNK